MSTRKDFEPTTIKELLQTVDSDFASDHYGADTEIRILSGPGKEWGILSVYENEGYIYLDIVPLKDE